MPSTGCVARWIASVLGALLLLVLPLRASAADSPVTDNRGCLACHGAKAAKIEIPGAGEKTRALMAIAPDAYGKGVHAKMTCVACHSGLSVNPAAGGDHKSDPMQSARSASCSDCHSKLWADAQRKGKAFDPRLEVVAQNIETYRHSLHAKPDKNDKSHPNADCDSCHDTHSFSVPPKTDVAGHDAWRLTTAALCGEKCHSDQLEDWTRSVHGKASQDKKDAKAAVCVDCHTAHAVSNTSAPSVKLAITANCGGCHDAEYKAYKDTYHGQITTLGYANTAKCFDCHGSHDVLAVEDPESKVNPANKLDTCKSCHNGKKASSVASAGFATFQPHANTHDLAKYPQTWFAFRMMVGLLLGTFAFFWLHTALWFWRELKERKQRRPQTHVKAEALPPSTIAGKEFQRFSPMWRIAHLTFALSLMILTLTGMPLMYADAPWAPKVMAALGGPTVAGIVHRTCAIVFAGVFVWHLVYIAVRLWRHRATFDWFGPNSLVPNLADMRDILGMFKWFFGVGPRPTFDRWTYWEKFDYWAPFWGVTIIGVSGLMMWVPTLTATHLPGWVFNVAAIFHGEEAFLAVVFLFTVHFFNNHFRPEKFPLGTVMFTGSVPLDEFRHEHPLQYERLSKSGELNRYLVDVPSAPMMLGSKILGFALIAFGLVLLFGVGVGFFGGGR